MRRLAKIRSDGDIDALSPGGGGARRMLTREDNDYARVRDDLISLDLMPE